MPTLPTNLNTEFLQTLFTSAAYKQIREELQGLVISVPNPLIQDDGTYDDTVWIPVEEPLVLPNGTWSVFVYRNIGEFAHANGPVLFTMLRLVPPDEYKQALNEAPESEAWKEASAKYSADLISPEAAALKLSFVEVFQGQVYAGEPYAFFPASDTFGLLETYDFDALVPYVDLDTLYKQVS